MANISFTQALESLLSSNAKSDTEKIIDLLKSVLTAIEEIKTSLNRIEKKIDSIIVGDLNNACNILLSLPKATGFTKEEIRIQVIAANKDFSQAYSRLERLNGFDEQKIIASFYCGLTHLMIGNFSLAPDWLSSCEKHIQSHKRRMNDPYNGGHHNTSAKYWATAASFGVAMFFPVVGVPALLASGYTAVKAQTADDELKSKANEVCAEYTRKVSDAKRVIAAHS